MFFIMLHLKEMHSKLKIEIDNIKYIFSVTWRLIELCRQLVDSKKDDGFSSLHLGK